MDIASKTVKIFQKEGKSWLIGGTWSAGGRFPQRANWKKIADEEGFQPNKTSNIWLKEEKQVGWYQFAGAPTSGYPLAVLALRKTNVQNIPWRGLFKMDQGWWFIAVDSNGAVHPRWDVWIEDDELNRFLTRHASEISSFKFEDRYDTADESWAWLLSDGTSDVKPVKPVLIDSRYFKLAILAGVAIFALTLAGYRFYEIHAKQEFAKKMAIAREKNIQKAMQIRAIREQQIKAHQALEQKLNEYWANYKRPFLSYPEWKDIIPLCDKAVSSDYRIGIDVGWSLTSISCDVSGAGAPKVTSWHLQISAKWSRNAFATVFHRPNGALSADGNSVVSTRVVDLPGHQGDPLPAQETTNLNWVGQSQRWNGIIKIANPKMIPFGPPPPGFLTPAEKKDYHPPILWSQGAVTLSSVVASKNGWSAVQYPDFVPAGITASIENNNVNWTLTGEQYAKP
jgi:hypothetical protein